MNNLSIKSKVLLITILPVIMTAFILSFSFIKERLNDSETALNEKAQTLLQYLAPALEYGVLSGNQDYLNSLAKNALSIAEVVTVTVVDINQHVLTQQKKNTRLNESSKKKIFKRMIFSAHIYQTEINIEDIDENDEQTLTGSRETIGTLTIEMSRQGISKTRKEIISNGILITFISLVFTIVLALHFSNTVVSPIRLLTKGIHRIRDGMLGERIYTGAGGEISILETGINNMSASLQVAKIKEKERADDTLFIEKSKAQITLEAIGEGVITTDINGLISYLNPAAQNLLGINEGHAIGTHIHNVFNIKNILTMDKITYPISTCLNEGKTIRHDDSFILVSATGVEFIIRDNATPLRSRSGDITGMVLVFHDFTELQRISDQLSYQATHDELTGLKNRREFECKLKDVMSNSNSKPQQHVVCYLDLDRFKIVNDTCGHIAGDALLKEVSNLISSQVRHNDLVARLGGDEFGIILIDCPLKQAILVSENIIHTIKKYQCIWEEHVFDIGVSIGLISVSSEDFSLTEIMMNADTACYIAKSNGKNQVHVYHAEDSSSLQRHNEIYWLQNINQALDKDGFELYCQPIAPADAEFKEFKYEVLLRLNDHGKLILPEHFLTTAEHYELMPEIDRWVISTFISLLENNDLNYLENKKALFNINISGQSICDDGFLDFIIHEFKNSSVKPALITFEITETVAIHNYTSAVKFISDLQELGCTFALDDFGNGLSSFRYLKELSVDYLKIDGHFIRNIEGSISNQSIVDAISHMAQALNLKTIAEFVETEASWEMLKEIGIDYIQGSVIEMPVPLNEILSRLKTLGNSD